MARPEYITLAATDRARELHRKYAEQKKKWAQEEADEKAAESLGWGELILKMIGYYLVYLFFVAGLLAGTLSLIIGNPLPSIIAVAVPPVVCVGVVVFASLLSIRIKRLKKKCKRLYAKGRLIDVDRSFVELWHERCREAKVDPTLHPLEQSPDLFPDLKNAQRLLNEVKDTFSEPEERTQRIERIRQSMTQRMNNAILPIKMIEENQRELDQITKEGAKARLDTQLDYFM